MKIKYFKNGILKWEEKLNSGLITRISYNDTNVTVIDLSDFSSSYEKNIDVENGGSLRLLINDSPELHEIYRIFDAYAGMKVVEFSFGDILIEIEW